MSENLLDAEIISKTKSTYDAIPYLSSAFQQASPLFLEACANILSLRQTPSYKAKILEIGCSYGGNLIPFAVQNSDAILVGIDLSQVQIDEGKRIVSEIGLKNLDLICADVCGLGDILDKYGKFDYIICHGVYSWVPNIVKDAILNTIKTYLAENGVAYISYNTYPGWNFKNIIRDFMLLASKNVDNPKDKLAVAKHAVNLYKDQLKKSAYPESKAIISYIDHILSFSHNESYLIHEYLETINNPLKFSDFVNHLEKFDLTYLCESTLDDIFRPNFGDKNIDEFLGKFLQDRIEQETFFDFLYFRAFRSSIITHKNTYDKLNKDIGVNEINKLHLVAYFENQDGRYFLSSYGDRGGVEVKNEYSWLCPVFNNIYPASINLSEVVNLVDQNKKLNTYLAFIEFLGIGAIFMPRPFFKIRYEVGKSRLKQNLIPYLKYFLKSEKFVISFANELNINWTNFKKIDAYTALKFDGKNSIQNITDDVFHYIKNNKITPKDNKNQDIKGESKIKKFAFDFVLNTEILMSQMYLFEEF